ncbi:MAG: sialate O-acetylesterase [Cyclobacteriaceae bacterium]
MRYFNYSLLFFLLTPSLSFSQEAPMDTIRVFFLAGQSNMDGYGYTEDLPEYLNRPSETTWIFHGNSADDDMEGGGVGIWETLKQGHGAGFASDGSTNQLSDRFGIELSLAHTLSELYSDDKIAFVKYANGGTSLDTIVTRRSGTWEVNYKGKTGINQYDHFRSTIDNAFSVKDINQDGREDYLLPSGIFWMQGESDGHSKEAADNYYPNLKRLLAAMRSDLRDDHLAIVMGKISDSGNEADGMVWDYSHLVQKAQEKLAKTESNAAIVRSTIYYNYSDKFHYDSEAYIDLGVRFAEAIDQLGSHHNQQVREVIHLWPDKVPGESEAKHPPVKSTNTSGNVLRIIDITDPALIVYEPKEPNNSRAGIIISPGGGYGILAVDKEGYEVAEWLNSLGYTAFVLQYRVPNKRQGALNDIQRAIRLVRSRSDEYSLNVNKIGVLGFSAGAHLSARAATGFRLGTYQKEGAIDQLSCRPNFTMLIYPAFLDSGKDFTLDPDLTIDQYTSPSFIFGTADDKYGNSSLVMAQELRDGGVPVELHMLPKGGHGYGLRSDNQAAETWPSLAEAWLENWVGTHEIAKYERTLYFPKVINYPKKLPNKKKVWAFLLAGQSNMAGRGSVAPQDTISSERILTLNAQNEIVLAKEPLHFYEPGLSGLDCGLSFGKTLLSVVPDDVSILLIPTAVGGSAINQWLGDSLHRDVKLLSNFQEMMELGKKYGTLKGILWHQGESDTDSLKLSQYALRLPQLMKTFRKMAKDEHLSILVGQLGAYSRNEKSWDIINQTIENYVDKDPNTQLIRTSDLHDRGDRLHFDAASQRLLGERFVNAFIQTSNE